MIDLFDRYAFAWQRAIHNAKQEVSEDLGVLERADLVYEMVVLHYVVAGYHQDANLEAFDDVVPEITRYLDRAFALVTLQFDSRQPGVQALWIRLLSCRFAILGCLPTEALVDLNRATYIANSMCKTGLTRDSELVTLRFLVHRFLMRVGRQLTRGSFTARLLELDAIATAIAQTAARGELRVDDPAIVTMLDSLLEHLEEGSIPSEPLIQRLDNTLQHLLQ